MCGRFVVTPNPETIAGFFDVDDITVEDQGANYNVAPTDSIYGVAEHHGQRKLGAFRWGLIPWWSKEKGPLHINARAESVASKATFRDAFARRRCLIPADGFYEWESTAEGKQPFFIHSIDGEMLAMAGIWSRWTDPATEDSLSTAAIVTTKATGQVANLHERMPVILPRSLWDAWLNRDLRDPGEVAELIQPISDLEYHPVSKAVNRVQNNFPECVMPVDLSTDV